MLALQPHNAKYALAPHLDPVLQQTVKALDALSDQDLCEVGFDPISEERDSRGKPLRQECVFPCTNPPIYRTPISTDWPLHLHVVGQISTATLPSVQEVDRHCVLPVATTGLWIEARCDLASQIQWQQMGNRLEKLVSHFPLVDELDSSAFFAITKKTKATRILVHYASQDGEGFPIFDADGDHIVLPDVSQVPPGVAVRVVFRLECDKKPGSVARFLLHAPIAYIAFA